MKTLSSLPVILLGIALPWTSAAQTAPSKESLPPLPAGKEWKLIWNDEFDGTKLDETKWNRLGDEVRKGGWWMKEDAYLSGKGTLLLRTKKDGDRFTCGAVNTSGKFEHAFGYYVARLKMPKQPGHWPAFWLMCGGVSKVDDAGRNGTEIDIVEIPWRDGRITMNLHWDGYGPDHKTAGGKQTKMPELTEGFHDYALLWNAGGIRLLRGRQGGLAHQGWWCVAGAGVHQADRGSAWPVRIFAPYKAEASG